MKPLISRKPSSTEASTGTAPLRSEGPADLTLIGTVHLNCEARSVLLELLDECRPAVVSVEISIFSVLYRTANRTKWIELLEKAKKAHPEEKKAHFRLKLLKRQILLPFEWETSSAYCREHGIPCLAIDSGKLARRDLPAWEKELLSSANIKQLVNEEDADILNHFDTCRARAERVLAEPGAWPEAVHPLSWMKDRAWSRRERLLAKRIRSILRARRPLVHIGGWTHLVSGSPWPTVATMLKDLEPAMFFVHGVPGKHHVRKFSRSFGT